MRSVLELKSGVVRCRPLSRNVSRSLGITPQELLVRKRSLTHRPSSFGGSGTIASARTLLQIADKEMARTLASSISSRSPSGEQFSTRHGQADGSGIRGWPCGREVQSPLFCGSWLGYAFQTEIFRFWRRNHCRMMKVMLI